jgi:hypothetical protein
MFNFNVNLSNMFFSKFISFISTIIITDLENAIIYYLYLNHRVTFILLIFCITSYILIEYDFYFFFKHPIFNLNYFDYLFKITFEKVNFIVLNLINHIHHLYYKENHYYCSISFHFIIT